MLGFVFYLFLKVHKGENFLEYMLAICVRFNLCTFFKETISNYFDCLHHFILLFMFFKEKATKSHHVYGKINK